MFMATEYFEKLSQLISILEIEDEVTAQLEVKHFFSGAALYANEIICVSWSPVGLAFKLPELEVTELISSGKARPLKYFDNGHVKKGYAMFENPEAEKTSMWKNYFIKAIKQIL
jgi:hypothetical protein